MAKPSLLGAVSLLALLSAGSAALAKPSGGGSEASALLCLGPGPGALESGMEPGGLEADALEGGDGSVGLSADAGRCLSSGLFPDLRQGGGPGGHADFLPAAAGIDLNSPGAGVADPGFSPSLARDAAGLNSTATCTPTTPTLPTICEDRTTDYNAVKHLYIEQGAHMSGDVYFSNINPFLTIRSDSGMSGDIHYPTDGNLQINPGGFVTGDALVKNGVMKLHLIDGSRMSGTVRISHSATQTSTIITKSTITGSGSAKSIVGSDGIDIIVFEPKLYSTDTNPMAILSVDSIDLRGNHSEHPDIITITASRSVDPALTQAVIPLHGQAADGGIDYVNICPSGRWDYVVQSTHDITQPVSGCSETLLYGDGYNDANDPLYTNLSERSFNVVLDASKGNGFDGLVIDSRTRATFQNLLTIKGEVEIVGFIAPTISSLNHAYYDQKIHLNNLKLQGDGNAGDKLVIHGFKNFNDENPADVTKLGAVEIITPGTKHGDGRILRGTLFELDVKAWGSVVADSLDFRPSAGLTEASAKVLTIQLKSVPELGGGSTPPNPGGRLNLVKSHSNSGITGVTVRGPDQVAAQTFLLAGNWWQLKKEDRVSNPGTTYPHFYYYLDQVPIRSLDAQSPSLTLQDGLNIARITGDWAGDYTGGTGPDNITINAGATASGSTWSLGAGDNVIKGSGATASGLAITMGDGNDTIGNFDPLAPDSDNRLALGGSVNLGHGANRVKAASAAALTAGRGNDTVIFDPGANAAASVDLGRGLNKLWVVGRVGNPSSRTLTLNLGASASATPDDTLRICAYGVDASTDTCLRPNPSVHKSFSVNLDTTQGSDWEEIHVVQHLSTERSHLGFKGSVSLNTAALHNTTIVANGATGDTLAFAGPVAFSRHHRAGGREFGTVMEFDIDPVAGTADTLAFQAKAIADTSYHQALLTATPAIKVRSKGGYVDADTTIAFATAHPSSAITGFTLRDPVTEAGAVIGTLAGGQLWTVESASGSGGKTYSLKAGEIWVSGSDDLDLGAGLNKVRVTANWSGDYTGAGGVDAIRVMPGATASGDTWNLGGGNNTITGGGAIAASVTLLDGDDTINDSRLVLSGSVSLGNGTNTVTAMSAAAITGGTGADTIQLGGAASGNIDLGGGAGNNQLTVGGAISGLVTSSTTGTDTVSIGGGAGNVRLGNGENNLTVTAGNWSGAYTDGAGKDTIAVLSGAEISSSLDLNGGGNNILKGAGAVSGAVTLGAGDTIGGSAAADSALALGAVNLHSAGSVIRAAGATSVTGGAGDDSVFLRPRESFTLSSLDLGAGTNKLWITGATGDPAGRTATVSLAGGANAQGQDTLWICSDVPNSQGGCGAGAGDGAVSAALDTRSGNAWENIHVDSRAGSGRSRLEIKGNVTLASARLNHMTIAADGVVGDTITFNGPVATRGYTAPDAQGAGEAGTLIELDIDPAAGTADSAVFTASATETAGETGLSPVVTIGFKAKPVIANQGDVVTIARALAGSYVTGVTLAGAEAGSEAPTITLNGQVWTLGQTAESGGTTFKITATTSGFAQVQITSASPERESTGPTSVTISGGGDWTETYTAADGILVDKFIIEGGMTASGNWDLKEGKDSIKAAELATTAAVLSGVIDMGAGDDVIGGTGASDPQSLLAMTGSVILGEGNNKMTAASAGGVGSPAHAISAGSGNDTVTVAGAITGNVDLGGGANILTAQSLSGTYSGGDGGDRVTVAEGSVGSADLMGGENFLSVHTLAGTYTGGDGADTVQIAGNAAQAIALGGGATSNTLTVGGAIGGDVTSLATGTDTVTISGGSGGISLGGGENIVALASGQWSGAYTDGDGDDAITVAQGASITTTVTFTGGDNSIKGQGAVSAVQLGAGDAIGGDAGDTAGNSLDIGSATLHGGGSVMRAASVESGVTGGSGRDVIVISGNAAGEIDLGDGATDNDLTVGGAASGSVTSLATGTDTVAIGGGNASVSLGGGENRLSIASGVWSGTWTDGSGNDEITVAAGAEVSANVQFSQGADVIKGAGKVTGSVTLGPGGKVGGAEGEVSENSLELGSLAFDTGGGMARAAWATSITGGNGDDSVWLKPAAAATLSTLNLGGGANRLWITGAEGPPASRAVTINLSGGPRGVTGDHLAICSETVNSDGACGGLPGSGYAFHVTLEASDNTWENITIGNERSHEQSVLNVKGQVTIGTAKLRNFRLASNGAAGDKITISGPMAISPYSVSDSGRGPAPLGALFELDFDPSIDTQDSSLAPVDTIEFAAGAAQMPGETGLTRTPSVRVVNIGRGGVDRGAVLEIARVGAGAAIDGISLLGANTSGGGQVITMNGQDWTLGSRSEAGVAVYFLTASSAVVSNLEITAGAADSAPAGPATVSISGSGEWSGAYTGAPGTHMDSIAIETGMTVSGHWELVGGADQITASPSGSGGVAVISGTVETGAGNDSVGALAGQAINPAQAPGPESAIEIAGSVDLGEGANTMRVASVRARQGAEPAIEGGSGNDTVVVDGLVAAGVDLKGGENTFVAGTLDAAYASGDGNDTVTLSGGSGSVSAGGGQNSVTFASGVWSGTYNSASAQDTITVAAGAEASSGITLSGGGNTLRGEGLVSGPVTLGPGDRIEGALELGSVTLDQGGSAVEAAAAAAITGGGGDDTIHLKPQADFTLASVDLGGGANRLWISGAAGNPESRTMALGLSGGASGARDDTLYLCSAGPAATGGSCAIPSGDSESHAFSAALDATGGSAWESVHVTGGAGEERSILSVKGDVTIDTATLNHFLLASNQSAGDSLTLAGEVSLQPFSVSVDGGEVKTQGTLFELDLDTAGIPTSDSIVFSETATLMEGPGLSRRPAIQINPTTAEPAAETSRINLLTVRGGGVEEINLLGAETSDGVTTISLNGQEWTLGKLQALGVTLFHLTASSGGPTTVTITSATGNHVSGGPTTATVSASESGVWTGTYTATSRNFPDIITIDRGMRASGDWSLGGGGDRVRSAAGAGASAVIAGRLSMGSGDDVIGGLAEGESQIEIEGSVDLGEGNNTMTVARAAAGGGAAEAIAGGDGNDTVTVAGEITGDVRLGDGDNRLEAQSLDGSYFGGSGADTVTLSEGAGGSMDMGGGENHLALGGSMSGEYSGGNGPDTIILGSESAVNLSIIAPGRGKNRIFITGAQNSGNPEISLSLSDGPAKSAADDIIRICGEAMQGESCAEDPNSADYSYRVTLDASYGNTWEAVIVKNSESSAQSEIKAMGSVRFDEPELRNAIVKSDGVTGALLSIKGAYAIQDPSPDGLSGTVFELDVSAEGFDTLAFGPDATSMDEAGLSKTPAIRLNPVGQAPDGPPAEGATLDIVTVAGGSDIEGVQILSDGGSRFHNIGGYLWTLGSADRRGGKVFFLERSKEENRITIGPESGDQPLSDGINLVTFSGSGEWSGNIASPQVGEPENIIEVLPGVNPTGTWILDKGKTRIEGAGDLSATVILGDGDDTIGSPPQAPGAGALSAGAGALASEGLALTGKVDLGGGRNTVHATAAASITAGAGNDTIHLKPGAAFSLATLNLGEGENKLFVQGSPGDPAGRRGGLSLSGGPEAGETDSLFLCNESTSSSGCADLPEVSDAAFSVHLDASGGSAWETITIGNAESEVQSQLTISGAVEIKDSELRNLRVAGNGKVGDQLTVSGTYGITGETVFELDFSPGAQCSGALCSDILRFSAATAAAGEGFGSAPLIRIAPASSETVPPGKRVEIARISGSPDIGEIRIEGAQGGEVPVSQQFWKIDRQEDTATGETVLSLLSMGRSTGTSLLDFGSAVAGQQILEISSGAADMLLAGRAARDSLRASPEGEAPAAASGRLSTIVSSGSETARLDESSERTYSRSFSLVSAAINIAARETSTGATAHFLSLQAGASKAEETVDASLAGIGYSMLAIRQSGAFYGLSASLGSVSSESANVFGEKQAYQLRSQTAAAEAGFTWGLSGAASISTAARLSAIRFGSAKLPGGGEISGMGKTSADASLTLSYGGAQADGQAGGLGLFGEARLSHDIKSSFELTQGGATDINSAKTWAGIGAGMSWSGPRGALRLEASSESSVGDLSGSRSSVRVGYDMRW